MLQELMFMKEEFSDFLRNSKRYGYGVMVRDLIGINRLYLQNKYIKYVLDFAKINDLRFTFFMTAKNLRKKLPIIKRMINDGHEIGSHSYNHIMLGRRDYNRIMKEFNKAQSEFRKYNIDIVGFRAPFLSISDDVIRGIKEIGWIYSSNVKGGKIFKYGNRVIEIPVIPPYDWEAKVVYGIGFDKLLKIWKDEEGAYLFHPWVVSKNLIKFKKEKLVSGKDYRIKSNLKKGKISVSFDVY